VVEGVSKVMLVPLAWLEPKATWEKRVNEGKKDLQDHLVRKETWENLVLKV